MQSNSATTKRRGGRGRVSLYLLLGAGIGATAALFFAPRKGSKIRKPIATEGLTAKKHAVGSLRKVELHSQDRTPDGRMTAGIAPSANPAVAARKRNIRTAVPPDMRISEQRYRVAHSGRRPSNIL